MKHQQLIVASAQNKGGVGKTTITVNAAAALGIKGYKVLVVDLDQQCNSTNHISLIEATELPYSISDLFDDYKSLSPNLVIRRNEQTRFINVDLLPSSPKITDAARTLQRNSPIPNEILSRILERVDCEYDFILIDCPPEISTLTYNALVATNVFMLPIDGKYALEGFDKIINAMESLDRINPNLKVLCPILNFYKPQNTAHKILKNEIEKEFSNEFFADRVVSKNAVLIPNATVFEQAPYATTSIYELASKNSTPIKALNQIVDLMIETRLNLKVA